MKRELVYGLVMLLHKGGAKKYIILTDYEESTMQRLECRKLVNKKYSSVQVSGLKSLYGYKLTDKGRNIAMNTVNNLKPWHI